MTHTLIALAVTVDPWLPDGSGWIGNWEPGIGDPTFLGWFTVVAYFAATMVCYGLFRFSRSLPAPYGRKEHNLWGAFGLGLLFLCINKQLDLQTAMTEILRQVAKHQGWYRVRGYYQIAFTGGMLLCLPLGAWVLFRLAKGLSKNVKTTSVGMVILAVFVLTRAASFHHVDRLLSQRLANFKINWILELGGIGVVLWGARKRWLELRQPALAKPG